MNERLGSGIQNPLEGSRPKESVMKTFGFTIPSERHPERNEDAIFHSAKAGVVMVLDGVGGVAKGDIASRTAKKVLSDVLTDPNGAMDVDFAKFSLESALNGASYQVRDATNGGGTTAIVARVIEEGDQRTLVWGNVGDSRLYLLRNGKLDQVTIDDNPIQSANMSSDEKRRILEQLDDVNSAEDLAAIPQKRTGDVMTDYNLSQYLDEGDPERGIEDETVEEMKELGFHEYVYRHRHWITQMVGGRRIRPAVDSFPLMPGDRIVLTSDGIHDNLTRTEIEAITNGKAKDPSRALVEAARTRSLDPDHLRAKADDMSAVVLDVIF